MIGACSPGGEIRGVPRTVLRAAWIVIAAVTLGLFAAGIPSRYGQILLAGGPVKPALVALGLSNTFYAAYLTALDVALVATHFAVAAVIFWRRSDEWMALFVALTLVTAPLSFIRALGDGQAGWQVPSHAVNYIGLVASLCLLYVFPDGRFVPPWTRLPAALWTLLNLSAVFRPASPLSLPSWPVAVQLTGWAANGVAARFVRCRSVSNPAQR